MSSAATAHLQTLMNNSVAPSTLASYQSTWRTFTAFSRTHGYCTGDGAPLPFTLQQVLHFIAAITDPRRPNPVSAGTVQAYISALRWHESWSGFNTLSDAHMVIIARIIRGIRRTQRRVVSRKLPMTAELLMRIRALINPNHNHALTTWAAMLAAFFGLLRSGEVASATHPFLMRDIALFETHATLHLRVSKTDQFSQGCIIALPRLPDNHPLCPVAAIYAMLAHSPRRSQFDLLFSIDGSPISRRYLVQTLRTLLTLAGVPHPSLYAGHSFRRGGATAARQAGLSDDEIKQLGRWTSETFRIYTATPTTHILFLAQRLLPLPRPLAGRPCDPRPPWATQNAPANRSGDGPRRKE
jgi:integrase